MHKQADEIEIGPDRAATQCDQEKTIDRLLNLWLHQNTLLWSRLQTIALLQVPVMTAWFWFSQREDLIGFAVAIATLGGFLSLLINELIDCDAEHRDSIREQVRKMDSMVFPHHTRTRPRGITIMKAITGLFVVVDFGLAYISIAALCGANVVPISAKVPPITATALPK